MRTRRAITDNVGHLGKIYERLRKRSLRAWYREQRRVPFRTLFMDDHSNYVRGVRDALNAVAADLGNPDK